MLSRRRDNKAILAPGVVHDAQGRYGPSEIHLRRAVDRTPESCDAWYNLGLGVAETARTEEAARSFERALVVDPDNQPDQGT